MKNYLMQVSVHKVEITLSITGNVSVRLFNANFPYSAKPAYVEVSSDWFPWSAEWAEQFDEVINEGISSKQNWKPEGQKEE